MPITTGPISVEKVCNAAKKECTDLLILGINKQGEPYFASTTGDVDLYLKWLKDFKAKLLAGTWSWPDPGEEE